jgi:hypothetical protein
MPELQAISTVTIHPEIMKKVKTGYQNNAYFGPICQALKQESRNLDDKMQARIKHYSLSDDLLYLVQDQETPRLCVPDDKELKLQLLQEHHDARISGHLGKDKTYSNLARLYFWPKLSKEVYRYIASCDACQRNKGTNKQPAGLLQPLAVPQQRWEQVSMDFIVQLPKTKQGHDAIFVIVDKLTKRIHLTPTHTTATAPEVAKIFFQTIFRHHSLPRSIVSDRDPKFVSKFWKALFKQLGVHLAISTAHHP